MARTIEIEDGITVGALAEELQIPVTGLIAELMKNGVLATVNERLDFDTAQIIVEELKLEVELARKHAELAIVRKKNERSGGTDGVAGAEGGDIRPPVVAVMGHVDHGKTSLLDAICDSKVTTGEAGGITQHISAYQVEHNKRTVTFLDTPGHEAFAAIREHGAHLTDVVIIVVAADDGIKPQTLEAIRFARKAGVKIIVAINKVDKEGANADRVKQQLAEQELLIEEWGGDIIAVEVSAKTKQNIDKLLDMVLLVADVEDLRADTQGPASGLIIEAHMEQGRGPVAVALIESGTLSRGDFVVAGATYAKIRNLESTVGKPLTKAGPSTPAMLTGFKSLPEFGDEFLVVKSEKEARAQADSMAVQRAAANSNSDMSGSELIRIINRANKVNELNIIIKADVQGSLTSVIDSLKTLDTDEVAIRIVGTGVGVMTEKDAHLAATSNAIIYGFNVQAPSSIKQLANRDRVSIRIFSIIYELIDDVKVELTKLLPPEIIRTDLGRLHVKGIFKMTKTEVICGGEVTKGKLTAPALATVTRDDEKVADVQITGLKRGPQEAKEVFEGDMCGVSFKSTSRVDLQENDRIEFYTQESVARTL
ncbi:MAG: translation initiation factor IF-2 [Candidatus Saccharimonadales bacterium]